MRAVSRGLDILISGALLVILSPLIALVALCVRLGLGSPVLFRHTRPGYRERLFSCLKFRTMTDARDASGNLLPDEQRITRLGMLMRELSLDELPNLWNVLTGEMALVGPRPLIVEYLPRYNRRQHKRHDVRPGLTGWAQVNGRNALSWEDKFEHDVWYVENWSLWLDLKILVLTPWVVLKRTGISEEGQFSSSYFMGSGDTSAPGAERS